MKRLHRNILLHAGSSCKRSSLLFLSMLVVCGILCGATSAYASSASVDVHGAKGSGKKEQGKDPEIPATLKKYESTLKTLGFGKYEDLSGTSGSAQKGGTVSATIDGYSVKAKVISVTKEDKAKKVTGSVFVSVTITKGDKKIGTQNCKVKVGQTATIKIGKADNPSIILIHLNSIN